MIRIATRSSTLAKAQASHVAELLGGAELVEVSSDGEPGDKARFVRGVERALLEGRAEIGVHSAKDVPAEMPVGLAIAAVPAREDPADVWIGGLTISSNASAGGRPAASLGDVPEGARVGTASLRRRAQLLAARPDLQVSELHGNVDTRLRKLAAEEMDAIVLAAAGLRRLGREGEVGFALPAEAMTPAAGQGALVLQVRKSDKAAMSAATAIGDDRALRELTAERAVVALLEADCTTPIGVHARVESAAAGDKRRADSPAAGEGRSVVEGGRQADTASLLVEAFVGLPDGSEWVRDRVEGDAAEPAAVGVLLAERLLAAGAREILDRAAATA